MVLTGAVLGSEAVHTRRRLLGAGAGLTAGTALAGCGLFGDDKPDQPKAPDPLRPLLDEALALAAAYDRAALAQPGLAARLTPLGADHREHVTALSQAIGISPPAGGGAAPTDSATDVLAGLRAAEQAAQKTAATACATAPAARAALAGSIAACRATHVEALR